MNRLPEVHSCRRMAILALYYIDIGGYKARMDTPKCKSCADCGLVCSRCLSAPNCECAEPLPKLKPCPACRAVKLGIKVLAGGVK